MILYDFTEHLPNVRNDKFLKQKISNFLSSDPDIFRREYPKYVKKRAICFRLVYKNPDKWKKVIKKYRIKPRLFKLIGDFDYLTPKYIIRNRDRYIRHE